MTTSKLLAHVVINRSVWDTQREREAVDGS